MVTFLLPGCTGTVTVTNWCSGCPVERQDLVAIRRRFGPTVRLTLTMEVFVRLATPAVHDQPAFDEFRKRFQEVERQSATGKGVNR
jgi:hypothetical protein